MHKLLDLNIEAELPKNYFKMELQSSDKRYNIKYNKKHAIEVHTKYVCRLEPAIDSLM